MKKFTFPSKEKIKPYLKRAAIAVAVFVVYAIHKDLITFYPPSAFLDAIRSDIYSMLSYLANAIDPVD